MKKKTSKMRTNQEVRKLIDNPTEENTLLLLNEVIKPFLITILKNFNKLDMLDDYVNEGYINFISKMEVGPLPGFLSSTSGENTPVRPSKSE